MQEEIPGIAEINFPNSDDSDDDDNDDENDPRYPVPEDDEAILDFILSINTERLGAYSELFSETKGKLRTNYEKSLEEIEDFSVRAKRYTELGISRIKASIPSQMNDAQNACVDSFSEVMESDWPIKKSLAHVKSIAKEYSPTYCIKENWDYVLGIVKRNAFRGVYCPSLASFLATLPPNEMTVTVFEMKACILGSGKTQIIYLCYCF